MTIEADNPQLATLFPHETSVSRSIRPGIRQLELRVTGAGTWWPCAKPWDLSPSSSMFIFSMYLEVLTARLDPLSSFEARQRDSS